MLTYADFKKRNIDLSSVGFSQSDSDVTYYCTPKDAEIIGWAGVDGIHYCTIPDFGDLIFAVSPMNFGDCVHPIARNFEDMLRLLLSCVDMAALEQCYAWDEEQYKAFLIDCPATEEQQAALDLIKSEFGLEPIADPFSYAKELQVEFDLSEISYTDDYYDPDMNAAAPEKPTEWQVVYGCGYWTKNGKGQPGEEITLNSCFAWDDEIWHIPAVYSCTEGLVVEFCVEIAPAKLKAFLDKWVPLLKENDRPSWELQEQIENENPLSIDFTPHFHLNGEVMRAKTGNAFSWIPEGCRVEGMEKTRETKGLIEHYGLDKTKAWSFHRWSCPWPTAKKPIIKSLKLRLERRLTNIEGIRFANPSVGDVLSFAHPITGTEHKLTVLEYEQQEMTAKAFANDEYEYPTHHTAMTYTIEPDLSNRNFQIRDVLDNDEPKRRPRNAYDPKATYDACSIGIIGGVDGPTAFIFSRDAKKTAAQHAALSALHFEPTNNVKWKIVFREKLMEDEEVDLIGGQL